MSSGVQLAVRSLYKPVGEDAVHSASERRVGAADLPPHSGHHGHDQVSYLLVQS